MEPGAEILPDVSVLVCSKGRRASLLRCLESLGRQTYPQENLEVVVVEETVEDTPLPPVTALDAPGLRHVRIRPHRKGFGHPRNIALGHARFDLVAFVDDDCQAREDWLAELVDAFLAASREAAAGAVLAENPGLLGMCELAAGFPGGGVRRLVAARGERTLTAHFSTCNVLLQKSAVVAAGGFHEGLRFGGEDRLLAVQMSGGARGSSTPRGPWSFTSPAMRGGGSPAGSSGAARRAPTSPRKRGGPGG